jgi:exosortase A
MRAIARPAVAIPAMAILAVIATFLALWPTTQSLSLRWMDTVSRAYTHGSLVPLIAAFLIWRRRDLLARVDLAPSLSAALFGVLLGVVWLVALRAGIQIGHQVLLPLIATAAVWAALGGAAVRALALPLAYLYFTIPIWDAINPALQWLSAFAVRGLLSLIGIPVYFDGLHFQIPAGVFEIAGGCSGLHFFIVSIAVAVFYGELHRDRLATRLKLVALAIGFAFITNWIRIAIIIYLGHKTEMQHPLVSHEHYTFGWGMFAVAMTLYFLIVRRWQAPEAPTAELPAAPPPPFAGFALALFVLAVPGAFVWGDDNRASSPAVAPHHIDAARAGFDAVDYTEIGPPLFFNADDIQARAFKLDGAHVETFVAAYREQAQGRELGGFTNKPAGGIDVRSRTRVAGAPFQELKGRNTTDSLDVDWLAWVTYRIDDHWFADELRSGVYYGVASLWSDPVSSALVLRTPCLPDCPAARERLARVAKAVGVP